MLCLPCKYEYRIDTSKNSEQTPKHVCVVNNFFSVSYILFNGEFERLQYAY